LAGARAADADPIAVRVGQDELAQPVVLVGDLADAVDAEVAQLFPHLHGAGDVHEAAVIALAGGEHQIDVAKRRHPGEPRRPT
jgi:hypothetical protein